MSNTQNAQWLEAALENFQEAVDQKDVGLAKAVIADLIDYGYVDEARDLTMRLRNANIQPTI